jgi:hypothetical protein
MERGISGFFERKRITSPLNRVDFVSDRTYLILRGHWCDIIDSEHSCTIRGYNFLCEGQPLRGIETCSINSLSTT